MRVERAARTVLVLLGFGLLLVLEPRVSSPGRSGVEHERRALMLLAAAAAQERPGATSETPAGSAQPGILGVDEPTLFAIGNIEFILLHELAHLVIRDFDVPVLGSEESAADHIAAAVLIDAGLFDPGLPARARQYLLATANGLAASWEMSQRSGGSASYWDSHALSIQRSLQIVCLLYGSDPDLFAGLPERVGMPESRYTRCPGEYARSRRGLDWLLANYGRQAGDPPGIEPSVDFGPAPTQTSARILAAMQRNDIVANTLARLGENFAIREPFTLKFQSCRQTQAGWLPETRELYVCYELFDYFYSLALTQRSQRPLVDE